ncbi:uncharacterized protein GLRG_03865 [Colletotrichum graminicola M1.001]|uniref:Uncharacterized protein n=1 Tax=Colletotrichum graminicola (strain M1.001 / M2 / FGSC 10212) TaxID=645133 RepID=E3QCU9_COLGM|nr:uncharacterized protein GLRG_03865 [Colletotrichum graminicola M1.001]EFQ28721.1 hypothetical protein GLRG_03865 [Colletotrichum graminicola M1.001]
MKDATEPQVRSSNGIGDGASFVTPMAEGTRTATEDGRPRLKPNSDGIQLFFGGHAGREWGPMPCFTSQRRMTCVIPGALPEEVLRAAYFAYLPTAIGDQS